MEAMGRLEGCDINDLSSWYVAACERHGTTPFGPIFAAFAKVRMQKEKRVLELRLSQIQEADIPPLVEMLLEVERSDLDALDVVYNRRVSSIKWQLLVQVMQAAGSKLRMADLRDTVLGREGVRELLQGGSRCQSLDLSSSTIRKMEMLGHFPNLHTLKLDNSRQFTSLLEGCFSSMPKLAKLSMCASNIKNLWTTCAALCELPALRELRFQKCLCCQGTGQCPSLVACLQNEGVSLPEGNLYQGVERSQPRLWQPPRDEDDSSHGTSPSDYSGSEDDLENLYAYAESEDNQLSGNSSGESAEESDIDQAVASEVQPMDSVIGDLSYNESITGDYVEDERDGDSGDAIADEDLPSVAPEHPLISEIGENLLERRNSSSRHMILDLLDPDIPSVEMDTPHEIVVSRASGRRGAGTTESEGARIPFLEALERVVATRLTHSREITTLTQDLNPRSSFRLTDVSREGAGEREADSSEERGEDQGLQGIIDRFISPICFEIGYRSFMITLLPALQVLDNMGITDSEREKARCAFEERFESIANMRREKENVLEVLKRRETGGFGVKASQSGSRLGYIDIEHSPVAYTRSLSAAKMGRTAWPATNTICRFKKPSPDGGRRCRPRQFEYHPTEPSYMVFGTLQGEVVVINHESDKVVGYVQSIGAPHSILGLCWLNKDPNKLIAGSDNGCLQLYDVNHMRASMVSAGRQGGGSSFSSRYQGHGHWGRQPGSASFGSRNGRSPTIYTYDDFEQLTSVHINSTDDYFLASGYSNNVGLYDLRTGTRLQIFPDLHKEHINVVKFANHSPQIFATSSFDKEIKMWDLRQKVTQPLYTVRSKKGNVMVCFSRDDHYLLSSAVDNEVRQHLAVDGRLHMEFDITPTKSTQNYTRSYYLNGRDYIISGSCEENVVRVCCAQTGRRLRDLAVEGRGTRSSLYVQSLRGDPFKDFHFCMLVAYNHPHSKSEIVKVNLLGGDVPKEGREYQPHYMPLTGMGA